MKTLLLNREDVRTDLYPNFWENICDDAGLTPKGPDARYPNAILITIADATDVSEEEGDQ